MQLCIRIKPICNTIQCWEVISHDHETAKMNQIIVIKLRLKSTLKWTPKSALKTAIKEYVFTTLVIKEASFEFLSQMIPSREWSLTRTPATASVPFSRSDWPGRANVFKISTNSLKHKMHNILFIIQLYKMSLRFGTKQNKTNYGDDGFYCITSLYNLLRFSQNNL